MIIESPVFQNNQSIPSLYTCDGAGINPPLVFKDVPRQTKSLALIMDDPDIPEAAKQSLGIEVWDHWVIFNILPTVVEIREGQNPEGILGTNTRGNLAYGGPCPPDREHRYFFKLYALDSMLSLPAGSTKKELLSAMKGHIIAEAQLIGRYSRQ